MSIKGLLTILKIPVTSLRAKNKKAPHGNIASYCSSAHEPDHRVSEKIDLAMIFNPEIL